MSLEILGVRIDSVSYKDLLSFVDNCVASGEPHQIVTVNPEMLVLAQTDPSLARVLDGSDLNVADGVGLTLAARLLGQPLPERVTGSDGLHILAAHCSDRGYRPFLLGAAEGVAKRAAHKLTSCHHELQIAGTFAGSPEPEDEDSIVALIREAMPDLLFVAYGVPAEELWIGRNLQRLGVPVAIGVGGAFDFAAGVTKRAPGWVRRAGLEWIHRLMHEPWRWRRQLALPRFALLILKQKLWVR
jgi:N-acetylglucosaminyldiphosphoundecaprenol N-acetyl-beta-D-mannosaminyltransferase